MLLKVTEFLKNAQVITAFIEWNLGWIEVQVNVQNVIGRINDLDRWIQLGLIRITHFITQSVNNQSDIFGIR